jgi:hypothetical protein
MLQTVSHNMSWCKKPRKVNKQLLTGRYCVCYMIGYEVKKTTRKLTQLPTTPIAEYELMNISGRNSYLAPNTS